MQAAEGTLVEIKGRVPFTIDTSKLVIPKKPEVLTDEEIKKDIERKPMKIVCATVGEDEHSVGLREIIDIKHGGIERFGIECHYLGTSCPVEKLVDAAIELKADAILASTIITHNDIHIKNMKKINDLCIEKGIRDRIILEAGGTQVTDEIAKDAGMDAGFGRGTKGSDVASFLVKKRWELEKNGRI
jgi:D-ornithine 4,5-aminomutase subunit beta